MFIPGISHKISLCWAQKHCQITKVLDVCHNYTCGKTSNETPKPTHFSTPGRRVNNSYVLGPSTMSHNPNSGLHPHVRAASPSLSCVLVRESQPQCCAESWWESHHFTCGLNPPVRVTTPNSDCPWVWGLEAQLWVMYMWACDNFYFWLCGHTGLYISSVYWVLLQPSLYHSRGIFSLHGFYNPLTFIQVEDPGPYPLLKRWLWESKSLLSAWLTYKIYHSACELGLSVCRLLNCGDPQADAVRVEMGGEPRCSLWGCNCYCPGAVSRYFQIK